MATFGSAIPGFFKLTSLQDSTRQLGEFSIVVTGLTVVMLGGGIDLSVGSIFALATFAAVSAFFIFEQPVWMALAASIATGLACGALNGYLVGYLRLRAFLTTLVTFDPRPRAVRYPGGRLRRADPAVASPPPTSGTSSATARSRASRSRVLTADRARASSPMSR